MTYLPTDLINSNYHYYSNGTYITIRTNNNCYSNYNTQYCDCFNIYPQLDYLRTKTYSCTGSSSQELDYSNFTDVLSYRVDFDKIGILIFICIFGLVFLLSCLAKYFFRGVFKS